MLEGQRVTLRPWCEADLDFFGQLRNDVETQLALLAQPKPSSASRVRQWLEARSSAVDGVFFVIAAKPEGRAVGFIELREIHPTHGWGNLGICLERPARGRGLAVEALELMETYLRCVLMVRKIVLSVAGSNTAARRLYESTGYATVGMHRAHYHVGGEWLDAIVMEKALRANRSEDASDHTVRLDVPYAVAGTGSCQLQQDVASP